MNDIIKKIQLDLGGKKVDLTPQQAKNLKDALDELFGKEIIREKIYPRDPYPYDLYPWRWVSEIPKYPIIYTSYDSNLAALTIKV